MVKRDVSRLVVSACCFVLLGLLLCFSTKSVPLRAVKAQSPAQTSGKQSSRTESGSKPDAQQPSQTSSPTSSPTSGPTSGQTSGQQQSGQKPSSDDHPVIHLDTELVTLSVTVTDPYNRLVTGLDKQHFEVYENKIKQNIEYFHDEDVPVSLGIVFDVSGSMKGKIDRSKEALKAFIQTSHDNDDFFLIAFNQRANLLAEFTDGGTMQGKLTLVEPKGQTAIYDAAYLGIEKVKQGHHTKRALLLISDGQDNSSRYTYGELKKLLKEANVQIYCIGIVEMGGGAGGTLDLQGQSILEEIAQVTGGKAFFPRSAPELEDATTRIALELRHQYSIGYTPTNVQRDGQWHRIKVKVIAPRGLPNLNVRAKEGYYAVK